MEQKTFGTRVRTFLGTTKGKILLAVVVLLVLLRIFLSTILLHYANKQLANMKGYYGHIDDVDVYLLRGAYTLDSIYINKVDDGGDQTEFFSSQVVDLSIEWRPLLKGELVGETIFKRPHIRFTKDRVELADVSKDTTSFQTLLRKLMPIEVNRVEIQDGTMAYIDNSVSPKVDVSMTDLDAVATNLKNAYQSNEVLPAELHATAAVYGGSMKLDMKMNPLADRATFDLNAEAEGTDLVKLNDFFKAYAGFDVSKGVFNMYTEAAAKEGKFKGYVKPVIKELDVVQWKGQDKKDNFFQKIYETVAEGVGNVLENPRKDQVATRVDFSGDVRDPNTNVWQTVALVLQNAFIQALKPSIENKINLAQVDTEEEQKGGFFQELFKKDDKDEKKQDEKKEKKADKRENTR